MISAENSTSDSLSLVSDSGGNQIEKRTYVYRKLRPQTLSKPILNNFKSYLEQTVVG